MLSLLLVIIKISILYVGLPYYVWTRVIQYFISYRFYSSQEKVKMIPGSLPILGDSIIHLKSKEESKRKGDNYNCTFRIMRDLVGLKTGNICVMLAHNPFISISDPKVVQELYTTKNSLFDKHPIIKNLTMRLTGKSILFAETDEVWRARRKALSAAFYKGQMVQLINMAKQCVQGTLERWIELTKNGTKTIDIVQEVNLMMTRIMLKIAIGENMDNVEIDHWEGGKLYKKDVPYSLRTTFDGMI